MHFSITEHARLRFVQRYLGKEGDVKSYIEENRLFVDEGIAELLANAVEVYCGLDGSRAVRRILVYKSWILLCGEDTLITLIKKDLGVDDEEMNERVMALAVEKIGHLRKEYVAAVRCADKHQKELSDEIAATTEEIDELSDMILQLEEKREFLMHERAAAAMMPDEPDEKLRRYLDDLLGRKYFGI